jgi:hypothetical protein
MFVRLLQIPNPKSQLHMYNSSSPKICSIQPVSLSLFRKVIKIHESGLTNYHIINLLHKNEDLKFNDFFFFFFLSYTNEFGSFPFMGNTKFSHFNEGSPIKCRDP